MTTAPRIGEKKPHTNTLSFQYISSLNGLHAHFGNHFWVMGGYNNNTDVYEYNPGTKSFTKRAKQLPQPRPRGVAIPVYASELSCP